MKTKFVLLLALLIVHPVPAGAQRVDTPMDFFKKFNGDQPLKFGAGGTPHVVKNSRLTYRVITNAQDWKRIWGYLYDDTLTVDFSKYKIVAAYKSPAAGGYDIIPKRVYNFEGNLHLVLEAVWNGKPAKSYPFLFLVVQDFKKLEIDEKFVSPPGKPAHFP